MPFSSLFRLFRRPAVVGEDAARVEATPQQPAVTAPPPAQMPEDLDARVRLLGEWQVSEL